MSEKKGNNYLDSTIWLEDDAPIMADCIQPWELNPYEPISWWRMLQFSARDYGDSSELDKFNAALRKMLAVPREEILKRDEEWKRKRAEVKRNKTSPASRASSGKG